MLVERRRSVFSPELMFRVGIAWVAVCAIMLVVNLGAIANHRLPGPDDVMRLVQVRDLAAGQGWFDLAQYRADGAVATHWSRLVDLPLWLVIAALSPIIGSANAETTALIIVPLMTLGLVMLLAARIVWRLVGDEEATLACIIVAISIPLLFELGPMRIDHHGWQIVCALVAMNGLMARSARRGGWMIGGALAAWLAISIEGLPIAAVICAVVAFRWLHNRNDRVWLVSLMQSLALTSAALFLMLRGTSDFAAYCDAVSPLHLAMFAWGAVVTTLVAKAEPLPKPAIWLGFGVAAGGAAAMMFYAAPQCAGGGMSTLEPVVQAFWFDRMSEALPIWRQDLTTALQYAIAPLIGIFATLNLIGHSNAWLRRFWTEYLVILVAAFVMSLLVARVGALAGALAVPPLAWQVRKWLRAIKLMRRPAPRALAIAGVLFALLPALPFMLLGWAIPAQASLTGEAAPSEKPVPSSCRLGDEGAGALNALPQGEVFAPLDIAPALLAETPHLVIGIGHHRASHGMRFVIETALGDSSQAKAALAARGTRYVAICPSIEEVRIYRDAEPDGFAARLSDGRAPEWLEPIALEAESGMLAWRVKYD